MEGSVFVNPDRLNELASEISKRGAQYETDRAELYNDMKELGNAWQSADYDAANAKMQEFAPALQELTDIINKLVNVITTSSNDYVDLVNKSANQFK